MSSLRTIIPGVEVLPARHAMARHRHSQAYAIIVIDGGFAQTSYAGRVTVRAAQLIVQPTLDCHSNTLLTQGARILRLRWSHVTNFGGVYRLRDLDALVRLAERDVRAASELAMMEIAAGAPLAPPTADWPDMLAFDLAQRRVGNLAHWAEIHGLAPETVSRGFTRAYGVGPAQFRNEMRARAAWLRVIEGRDSFARIASETGFADHAHMTRSIVQLTGRSPSAWRRTTFE